MQKKMRDHLLAGVHQHRDEFATLIDKFPFSVGWATWAAWHDDRDGRIVLSRFLLREPPELAARIYLRVACDSLMMRREISALQMQDVFARFGFDMVFESSWDLYRDATATRTMRVVRKIERVIGFARTLRLPRDVERGIDVALGGVLVLVLQLLIALPPAPLSAATIWPWCQHDWEATK